MPFPVSITSLAIAQAVITRGRTKTSIRKVQRSGLFRQIRCTLQPLRATTSARVERLDGAALRTPVLGPSLSGLTLSLGGAGVVGDRTEASVPSAPPCKLAGVATLFAEAPNAPGIQVDDAEPPGANRRLVGRTEGTRTPAVRGGDTTEKPT